MTDKEKLGALLTEFGVGWVHSRALDKICCYHGMPKITGYSGFETIFEFDDDGKFLQMGAWE